MKDLYDIWLIVSQHKFDGAILANALRLTYDNRRTKLNASLVIFSKDFHTPEREKAWKAIEKKLALEDQLPSLSEALNLIELFLIPVLMALEKGNKFDQHWKPDKIYAWY